MYAMISTFQCYTISVDVYFPYHCTLWKACFTFLLMLCYCCCAHDNDVSHTLHREWGITISLVLFPSRDLTSPLEAPGKVDKGSLENNPSCLAIHRSTAGGVW